MRPTIPREFLWGGLGTMDEFFRLDPVNENFYETFVKLREEPFGVTIDAVRVFNEVYYNITRVRYAPPKEIEYSEIISDIKANLGWKYSAELVLTMVFWLTELSLESEYVTFRYNVAPMLRDCDYWKPFSRCYERIKKSGKRLRYEFKPRPVSPEFLRNKYISWMQVTRFYDLEATQITLNLWGDIEERKEVAAMIRNSMDRGRNIRRRETDDDDEVLSILDNIIGEDISTMCVESSPNEEALQDRISELEAEVERLNTLMEEKKQSGKDRKFTLVQMVDYCKGCVDWNDVKSIVAMLNKLLRRIGTDEDSDLVDSIEAEFINRKYGDTVMGDKNEFTGNSAHNTITLPRGITPQQALRLLQNKKNEDGEEG